MLTARMLSPDNYVQNPHLAQGYNRYSYAGNNPVMYTDPDGQLAFFIPLIIGFAAGYASSGIQSGDWGWSSIAAGIQGAVLGGVGAGIGGAISPLFASWGLVGGGIATGAITGGIVGGYSSVLNGGNFWDGATNGALWGGALGGASGLVQRLSIKPSSYKADINATDNGQRFTSTNEINDFVDENIGNHEAINNKLSTNLELASKQNLPKGSWLTKQGMIMDADGPALGITYPKGGVFSPLRSEIRIASMAKGVSLNGVSMTKMIIAHEYLHAYHIGLNIPYNQSQSESAARQFNVDYMRQSNMINPNFNNVYYQQHLSAIGSFPTMYSWQNLNRMNIINFGIR